MYKKNFNAWPPGRPFEVESPSATVYSNLECAYAEYADKVAMIFYETPIKYREFYETSARLAGWLHQVARVEKGDRVAILAQNSPQFVIAYYAILRAGAVVVPLNPMYVEEELEFLLDNSGAKALFAATELHSGFTSITAARDLPVIGIEYSDYLRNDTRLPVPEFIMRKNCPAMVSQQSNYHSWNSAVEEGCPQPRVDTGMKDLVMLPYTSGSTGDPKGCMHDNTSVQHALNGLSQWFGIGRDDITLAVAPMFHVVGLQAGMNVTIAQGGTLIILPRWDREVAAHAIHNFNVTVWPAVPTMVLDLINMDGFDQCNISSLRVLFGGGSSMPEAVAERLHELCGVTFLEGYGMTETCCPGTANPPHLPRAQCAGVPIFNTDVRVVDTLSLEEVPTAEVGEVLISGPQLMQGYWRDEDANAEAFVNLDGERYLRTGDLGYMDDEGYLYIVDRIKRMINASGFKVWPTQVEAVLHRHPGIEEVCVIASQDPKRGETVKALIVRKRDFLDLSEERLVEWCREHMAAYKIPRIVEFVDTLPKSASGKLMWKRLQELELSDNLEF